MRKLGVDWRGILVNMLKAIGGACLRAGAFLLWIALSGISLLIREISDSLKRYLFGNDD